MNSSAKTRLNDEAAARVTDYARAVVAGEIVAGPHVRAAVARHLRDLEDGAERGLRFEPQKAGRALRFFPTVLKIRGGDKQMQPFELLEWQAFIVGALFGWEAWRPGLDGTETWVRRFNEAYVETAKGSGKSPLAAGIGHYMLVADGELEPEVYAAATKKDQAMVLFRDAVAMQATSRALTRRLTPSGRNPVWQLSDPQTRGFFKPISNDDGQSGPRPYCALVDEVHEHKDGSTIEMLKAGFKGRQNPLLFAITNSGSDMQGVCRSLHEHGAKVAAGDVDDDAFFAYICGMDEGDDPMKDPSCWIKANPSLGKVVGHDYIERAVRDAKLIPGRENTVRRLFFCEWVDAPSSWLSREVWDRAEAKIKLSDYRGRRCWGGLDLSFGQDLTALALVFESPEVEGALDLFVEFWKPRGVLRAHHKRDRFNYPVMAERGYLNTPEGEVLKLGPVARRLGEVATIFDLRVVAYDRYRHKTLVEDLAELGIEDVPMVEHPQGFRRVKDLALWMPESVQETENAVLEGRLRIGVSPVLRWNIANAVLKEDPSGIENRILDKRKSTGRIDGIVAAVMAIGAARGDISVDAVLPSYLETEDLLVL